MTTLQKITSLNWFDFLRKIKEILLDLYNSAIGGGIPEAPIDGTQYARQDATWTEVSGGGGGSVTINNDPYSTYWSGDTTQVASKNSLYNQIEIVKASVVSGVKYYNTYALMVAASATGVATNAYKVISDPNPQLNGDYSSNGTTYTQQTFAVTDVVKKLNLSIQRVIQNPVNVALGIAQNYSVSARAFIPITPISITGYLQQFSIALINTQADRTTRFQIFEKTGTNDFVLKYQTADLSTPNPGIFTYNLIDAFPVNSGWYIGSIVTTTNTANSFSMINSGGPIIAGGWNKSTASIVLGTTQTFAVESGTRLFQTQAIVSEELILKANKSNSVWGFVPTNENAKVPKTVISENDYWAGKKIIWVGTSIPGGGLTLNYPKLVGENLNAVLVNESVGSSGIVYDATRALTLSATIAELTATFPGNEPQSYQNKIIGKNADLLVIDHIYNDMTYMTGSLGTIDSTVKTTVYGAFNFVIQAALADRPTLKLLFVTPPNRYEGSNINGDRTIAQIDQARDIVFNLAKKYNAPVCDLALLCNIHSLNYTQYKVDKIHPLDSDRPRLAHILTEFIKKY